jgi:hypothetical protein
VPVTGGPVQRRRISGSWQLTAWPWLTSPPGPGGTPAKLYNLTTDERRTVAAPADQIVSCSPVWCRTLAGNATDTTDIALTHPDGTGRQRVGTHTDIAVATDIALLDRFEVIATPAPLTAATAATTEKVSLFDLDHHRSVLIAATASGVEARGTWLWWSTGDHETLTWHALDLRTLA